MHVNRGTVSFRGMVVMKRQGRRHLQKPKDSLIYRGVKEIHCHGSESQLESSSQVLRTWVDAKLQKEESDLGGDEVQNRQWASHFRGLGQCIMEAVFLRAYRNPKNDRTTLMRRSEA